ncbi:MAG: hypothetical protein IKM32_00195 [Clostridia bacterium]|nr:hypothetical protein [Clostridia bacterium]
MESYNQNEKMSFGEWIENIWYHYKWLIIFGGVLAAFIIISVFQIASTKDPDVNILHVGPMYISAGSAEKIESTMSQFTEDVNDDGKIKVDVLDITVNKFGTDVSNAMNYDDRNKALQRFQTEIRAGDAVIYALDKEFFDICIEEGLLTPLNEVLDDAYIPANNVEGYGVYVSELDAFELDGLSSFPKTAILCLRRSPDKEPLKYGRTQEVWDGNRKAFVKLIKYQAPEESEESK